MGKNNLDKRRDADLIAFGKSFSAKAADGGFGLPADLPLKIANASAELQESLEKVSRTQAQYHAAVSEKNESRSYLVGLLATAANHVYADTDLTQPEIVSLGLQPRKEGRTPVKPTTPESLIVTAHADGHVEVSWSRSGNPQGVIFQVEAQNRSGEWRVVKTTTRCNVTLTGFPPGEPAWFRVTAHKTIYDSLPSHVQSIYAHEIYARAA